MVRSIGGLTAKEGGEWREGGGVVEKGVKGFTLKRRHVPKINLKGLLDRY